MDYKCPNCDRGLVYKTNEFCLNCAGRGVLQDNVQPMEEDIQEGEVVAPEAEEVEATEEVAPAEEETTVAPEGGEQVA